MSEQASTLELIAFFIGMIPGAYFAYRLLVEVYHYFTKKDDDFL